MEKVYSLRNLLVIFLLSCVTLLSNAQPTFEYAKQLGHATYNDQGLAVTNFDGNLLFSGFYRGSNIDLDPGASNVNSGGNNSYNHIVFGNYDDNGNYVRARSAFNNGDKAAYGIAVNGSGDYYVTGALAGAVSPSCYFDNFMMGTGALAAGGTTTPDIFFAKYDVFDGYQWAFKVGGSLDDQALAITSDNTGNFYITGYFQGSNIDFDVGPGTYPLSAVNGLDIFVAKYNGAGNIQWAINMGGSSSEKGTGIAVDASGNVYVTGTYNNTVDFDPSGLTANLTEQGSGDVFLAKYNGSTGALIWAKSMGGGLGDQARGIAVDGSSVYITGYFQGTADFDPGAGVLNPPSNSLFDVFVGKYNQSDGALVWCKGFGGTGDDQGSSIAVGSSGDVYVAGHFNGTVDFDPSGTVANKTSAGGEDIFIARFTSAGNYSWAYNIGGISNDRGNGISVDAAGYIYLTGYFQGSGIDFDITGGSTTLPGIGQQDIFFAKYYENTCVAPTVTAQPTDVNGCTGANASFTITATGAGLNYYWQHNSVNLSDGGRISGANTQTLTITGLVAGDAGNYTCLVTGTCTPADISNAAVLTVGAGPSITSQPSNTSACVSQNASFSVTLSGAATGYQWRKGGVNLNNTGNISGATSATLNITGVLAGDGGNYDCVITTSCGNITSNTAALTINTAPSISSHPSNATICSGANTTFTVTASGAGLTYQWRKGVANLSDAGIFSGTNTATLTLTGALAGDAGNYNCVVSGTCTPAATSNDATLTINAAPAVSSHPSNATICSGGNTTFTVTATGAGLTYQWRKGVTNLNNTGIFSGTTTATLTLTGAMAGDAGNYNCVVSGTCTPAATSNDATLTINTAPAVSSHPSNASVCTGNNTSFSVTATGAGLTYQWRKGGVNISDVGSYTGTNTATLNITGVVSGDAGNYDCVISGTCTPAATSNAATLTVGVTPSVSVHPSNQTVCAGQNTNFSVTATGSSFRWQKGGVDIFDGGNISGAATTTLTITGATAGDAGTYHCVVNGCPSGITSNDATLTINTAPSISSHPSNASICSGNNTSFSVTASGTGLTYQWRKGGVNISDLGSYTGTNTMTLNVTSAVAGDAGSYDCVVSGTCTPAATSNAATLTVGTTASITMDPSNQTTCVGQNINFSVTATGSSFRWQKGGVDIFDGGNISGAATTTLTITGAIAGDAGTYHCVVNGCPSNLTSADATLTVNTLPAISSHPTGTSVCPGANVNFTVTASGTGATYQWQLNGGNVADGGSISGATTNTLTITGVVAGDAGDYTCIVSGICTPSVTSNIATLNVLTVASITMDPTDLGVCAGNNAVFTATATGSSFKWQKNGVDVVNGGTISGATTTTLTITGVVAGDAGDYTLIAVGCPSDQTSAIAELTVNTAPAISAHPSGANLCPSANVTFNVTASGSGLTYQWQLNGGNVSDGGSISGATTNSLTITGIVAGDAGDYTCIVSGACTPSVTSNIATLNVLTAASITMDPTSQGVCAGNNAIFTATATGSSFKWQKDGVDLSNGGNISGATTTTLTITGVGASDEADYTLIAVGCPSDQTSAIATLTVNTAPSITSHPTDEDVCPGSNVTFDVTATGSGLTYQWQLNGGNVSDGGTISGATTASLTITGVVAGDAGDYTCIVSGTCTPDETSDPATLTVGAIASITVDPTDQGVCEGGNATLTTTATGSVFKWQKDGVDVTDGGTVSGATTTTLTITGVVAGDAGDYTLIAEGCPSDQTSAIAVLTVNTLPAITTHPSDQNTCTGSNVTLTVVATGSGLTYQWQLNGVDISDVGPYSGTLTASLTITGMTSAEEGDYTCNVSGTCAPMVTSNISAVTIVGAPAVTTDPTDQSVCTGQDATFTVVASNAVSYLWYKNGVAMSDGGNISGSLTASLTITSTTASDEDNYYCEITGCSGTVNSATVDLTVGASSSLDTHPSDVTECSGNNASFAVTASGSSLTYQWQKDGVDVTDGGTISGATTATLDITGVTTGDAGDYTCIVTSMCALPLTSNIAVLIVNTAPAITTDPVSTGACTGQNLTLTVAATGDGLTYQWEKNGSPMSDGGTITGSLTASLNISSIAAGDAADYTCVVSGACTPSVTSNIATITIGAPPAITTQPTSVSGCTGNPVSFTVVATGSGLTYKWQKNSVDISDAGTVSGSSTATLNISSIVAGDAGTYRCVVTSSCASSVTSATATLTVGSATASITGQPVNATVCTGQDASFFVTVSGSGMTYQWQKNGVSLSNGGNISGATSFALLVTNVSASDLGSYRCLISSGCAVPLISAAAGLSIGSPNILVQPLSSSICNGVVANFDVIATGVGLSYQWQKDGVNLTNGSGISGATTASLSISNTIVQSSGDYTCMISSSACPPPSSTFVATLTVSQCTDVTDAEAANLTVYPNPNDGHFNVNFYSTSGEISEVHVYSSTGTEVFYAEGVEQFASKELDLSSMPAGIYFVKVMQGDRTFEQKIVVKK